MFGIRRRHWFGIWSANILMVDYRGLLCRAFVACVAFVTFVALLCFLRFMRFVCSSSSSSSSSSSCASCAFSFFCCSYCFSSLVLLVLLFLLLVVVIVVVVILFFSTFVHHYSIPICKLWLPHWPTSGQRRVNVSGTMLESPRVLGWWMTLEPDWLNIKKWLNIHGLPQLFGFWKMISPQWSWSSHGFHWFHGSMVWFRYPIHCCHFCLKLRIQLVKSPIFAGQITDCLQMSGEEFAVSDPHPAWRGG